MAQNPQTGSDAAATDAAEAHPAATHVAATEAAATEPAEAAAHPEAAFRSVASELAPAGAETGLMFGHPALKLDGTVFACEFYGAMAFKLGHETAVHGEALLLRGAILFDPSRRDRPFRDWVEVPASSADQWPMLAQAALDHVIASATH